MDNHIFLPGNHIDPNEKVEKKLVERLLPKYLALRYSGKTNQGYQTVILVSNADSSGRYNSSEHIVSLSAAYRYKALFGINAIIFNSATSSQLKDSIQDSDVRNIFVIGHASYHSWLASDKSVNWFDLGEMVGGHLKNGIFANVGCGRIHSNNMIPLGYFVVSDPRRLIGYEDELAHEGSLDDLSKLKPFRKIPSLSSLIFN